jgi:antitoxin (DNA-binding transcriptional repressor) of toxin-antitoxin stability system
MLVVSTREFRTKQSKYLEMVNNGTELVLKSREKGSFVLTPISQSHTILDKGKEYILAPDEDLARAVTGEQIIERLIPRIEKLFNK